MNIETAVTVAAILGVIALVWGAVKLVKRYPYRSTVITCTVIAVTAPVTLEFIDRIIADTDMAAAVGLSMVLLVLLAVCVGVVTFMTSIVSGEK